LDKWEKEGIEVLLLQVNEYKCGERKAVRFDVDRWANVCR
jgi:hypothetical protein